MPDGTPRKQEVSAQSLYSLQHKTIQTLDIVPVTPQEIAKSIADEKGWTGNEWSALVKLWGNESGWRTNAVNPTSGACGIPQAWPCSKIGDNWQDPRTQLEWGAKYISERYSTPSQAVSFWYSQCGSSQGCWY